eukprot:4534830-Lingulodinium_polyedra.AAC.1
MSSQDARREIVYRDVGNVAKGEADYERAIVVKEAKTRPGPSSFAVASPTAAGRFGRRQWSLS